MKIGKHFVISLVGAALVLTMLPFSSSRASADPSQAGTGTYVTNASITLPDNSVYVDGAVNDSTHTYYLNNDDSKPSLPSCSSKYIGFSSKDGGSYPGTGILYVSSVTGSGATQSCAYTATTKLTLDTSGQKYTYVWASATTIKSSDGSNTFTQQSGTTFKGSSSGCSNTIVVASTDSTKPTTGQWDKQSVIPGGRGGRSGCKDNTTTVQIAALSVSNGVSTPPAGGACADGSTADSNGNCTGNADTLDCGSTALNWLICPVIQIADSAASKLDSFIMNTLDVDVKPIFDTTTKSGSGYYSAWSSFRVIATALLVIGGLVMVASQAIGFEALDAYTVRKVLPRLLIAVIGISLSWPLMKLAVSFFDTLGFDLRNLMYAPFKNFGGTLSVGTSILTTLSIPVLLIAFGPAALTFLITALLAVFVGFLILVVRQVAIIMLIVLAPIAIACYILPNTQKVWKLWYDNFLGLLLMFPIISALIAAGHIFAAVSLSSNSGNSGGSIVGQAVAMVAYFIPYFLLPLAARLATGVIGNLAGAVNNQGKGAFDRLKKFRGTKLAENTHKMKSGNRFSDRNVLTRGFNRTSAGASAGYKGNFGLGERGRESFDQTRRVAAMNDIMKSPGWSAIQHDDDALKAATYKSAAEARAAGMSGRSIAAVQASVGFGRPQAIAASQQLAATGTGYKDIEEVAETIARASGGNASTIASIAGNINSETKRAGRHDLAPGFAGLHDLSRQAAGLTSSGGGDSGRPMTFDAAHEKAWESGSLYQHANDKSANLKAAVNHFQGELNSGDQAKVEKAGVFLRELQAMAPNATGDNKKVIDEALANMGGALQSQMIDHDPTTGALTPRTRQVRRVDPADPNNFVYENQPVTLGDVVAPRAREYQRPDPNNMS